jgi:uncharacterized protein with HEPN domain
MALILSGLSAVPVRAQFTAEETAQRSFWEEYLKTAEILSSEEIGEGVTKPLKLYLQKGDVKSKACWKNLRGLRDGFLEGWQYEIAAYELDKLLGLNMVPPAVERDFNGKPGALIYWITSEYSLLDLMEKKIPIPESAREHTENMKYLARAWDCLLANDDRTQQNIRYTKDWRVLLIDHSQAFRSTEEYTERLIFGRNGIKHTSDGKPFLFRRLPRWFVEKLRTVACAQIQETLASLLTEKEVDAVCKRKTLLLTEIDALIKESGEANVLF